MASYSKISIAIGIMIFVIVLSSVKAKAMFSEPDTLTPLEDKHIPMFLTSDVQYFSAPTISSKQLKGKWHVLYFWNENCSYCLQNMATLNYYNQKFAPYLSVILFGYTGSQYGTSNFTSVRKTYERQRKKENLSLPIVYDSTLFHSLSIYACPFILIVNPNGVIKGVTLSLTEQDIDSFLRGVPPVLPKAWRKNENKIVFDRSRPFLIEDNGGYSNDYIFRTVFSEFKEYMTRSTVFTINDSLFQVIGSDLGSLYTFAYLGLGINNFGQMEYTISSPTPILKLSDSSNFKPDYRLGKKLYCFSFHDKNLKGDKRKVMEHLRLLLSTNFPYKVHIIQRPITYYKLIRTGKHSLSDRDSLGTMMFKSPSSFLETIYLNNLEKQLLLVGATADQEPFWVPENLDFRNLNEVDVALKKVGLRLVKAMKKVKTVLITD